MNTTLPNDLWTLKSEFIFYPQWIHPRFLVYNCLKSPTIIPIIIRGNDP